MPPDVKLPDEVILIGEGSVTEKKVEAAMAAGASLPKTEERPIVTISVGEPEEGFLDKKQDFLKESIIILREGHKLIPKVTVLPIKTGTLVDVEFEVVKDLAQNPLHQKMLLDIVKLTNTFNP